MGGVRTKQIKTIGKRLYELYVEEFKPDFEYNKKIIDKYLEVRSKRLRNFVAGYVTHLVNKNLEKKTFEGNYFKE